MQKILLHRADRLEEFEEWLPIVPRIDDLIVIKDHNKRTEINFVVVRVILEGFSDFIKVIVKEIEKKKEVSDEKERFHANTSSGAWVTRGENYIRDMNTL